MVFFFLGVGSASSSESGTTKSSSSSLGNSHSVSGKCRMRFSYFRFLGADFDTLGDDLVLGVGLILAGAVTATFFAGGGLISSSSSSESEVIMGFLRLVDFAETGEEEGGGPDVDLEGVLDDRSLNLRCIEKHEQTSGYPAYTDPMSSSPT